MRLGINFFGPIYSEDGIGEAARLNLKAFQLAGIDVEVNPLSRPVSNETCDSSVQRFNTPHSINYFHFSARWVEYYLNIIGHAKLQGKYNIGYWVTEMPNYPNEWAKNQVFFDEIWTASAFCQDSISMKISKPTILIPHPIVGSRNKSSTDLNIWGVRFSKTGFYFLVMANMYSDIERKNVLQSLEAFEKSFSSNSAVYLIVKISNPEVDPEYMSKILNYSKVDNRIIVIDQVLTRSEVDQLFQFVDVYVSLHRAEGFGLTLGEAMYHEVPVITTAYSGNVDFCNHFNSFLVDYDLVAVGENRLRYRESDTWAQPRMDSAVKMFKLAYADEQKRKDKTLRAKEFIDKNFSMLVISEKIKKRINSINTGFNYSGSFGEFSD